MDKSIDKSNDNLNFEGVVTGSPAFGRRPIKIVNSFTQGVQEEKNVFKNFY